jgi:hypothetical protein
LNGNWSGFGTTDMFLDRSHMMQISDPNILPKEANRVLQSIIDYS